MPRLQYSPRTQQIAHDLAGIILPAFQRESLDGHTTEVMKHDSRVYDALEADPRAKRTLERVIQETYNEHHKYIAGAKVVDTTDRIMAAIGGTMELLPAYGTFARFLLNLAEVAPKLGYAAWYERKSGDKGAFWHIAKREALSFIPYLGTIIDMKAIYLERVREHYLTTVADRFIERMNAIGGPGPVIDITTTDHPATYVESSHAERALAAALQERSMPPNTTVASAPADDIGRAISSILLLPAPDTTKR
ncbi:TPA: hypothetical protein HA251_08970 [Candidatus Woesearchaeota archaeon]|nr:hypothetical protein [Candidatus Woesearchaeota archaeon]